MLNQPPKSMNECRIIDIGQELHNSYIILSEETELLQPRWAAGVSFTWMTALVLCSEYNTHQLVVYCGIHHDAKCVCACVSWGASCVACHKDRAAQ